MQQINPQFEIKILVAGDKSVGKSTFIKNIIRNPLQQRSQQKINPTFGMEFHKHQIEMYGEEVNMRISDMPGGIRSMLQIGSYAQKYDLIFLCFTFDDDGQSVYNCLKYLEFIRRIKNNESVSRQFSMAETDFSQSNLQDLQNMILQQQQQEQQQETNQSDNNSGKIDSDNNSSKKQLGFKNELIINSTGNYDNVVLIGIHKNNINKYSIYNQDISEEKSEVYKSSQKNQENSENNYNNNSDETQSDVNTLVNSKNFENSDINNQNKQVEENSNCNIGYNKQQSEDSQMRQQQKEKIDKILDKIINNFDGVQYIDYSQIQDSGIYKDMSQNFQQNNTLNENFNHVLRNFLSNYKPAPQFG